MMLLLTGCSDFLDEDLKSSLAPDNTYTSSHGFEVGIAGLYDFARSEWNTWGSDGTNDYSYSHGYATPYEVLQIGCDLAVTGHNDGGLKLFDNLSYTPSTSIVRSYWTYCYRMIANANMLLDYSENSNVKWDKSTDKIGYQAEARFFRAYAYRYLVYLYGDVPYVDKVEKDFRTDYTRTPKAEVLGHMIDDLKFAVENLPFDPDKVDPGRLTKWAAEHLLSEVYLMAGMPQQAEAAAQDVINSGYFHLMTDRFGKATDSAGDAFSDLFKENNQNRTSGNMESIWVIQLEYNTLGGGGAYADWTKRAWVPKYWQLDGFTIADSLGGRGLAQLVPLKWWVDGANFYDKNDIRNSEYNIKRNWYCNDPTSSKYGEKVEITDETRNSGRLCPAITKFFYGVIDRGGDTGYGGNNKDRMKFRLAETYLLLAEARLDQGNRQGAADAINAVRARAHATPITASDVTVDFLLDERIRELVGEEMRRFTLSRFPEKYIERSNAHNDRVEMTSKYLLWPIPQSVINSNSGATLEQNPGWEE